MKYDTQKHSLWHLLMWQFHQFQIKSEKSLRTCWSNCVYNLWFLTGSVSVRLSFHTSSKATTISWSSSRDRTPSRSTSNTLKQTGEWKKELQWWKINMVMKDNADTIISYFKFKTMPLWFLIMYYNFKFTHLLDCVPLIYSANHHFLKKCSLLNFHFKFSIKTYKEELYTPIM